MVSQQMMCRIERKNFFWRKPMTVFYCVRHGKTMFNQKGIFQGSGVDSPLTEEGIQGAKHLGKQLSKITFDQVVVSPLKRAMDTCALLINENQMPLQPVIEPTIREMGFGEWEGKLEANYSHLTEFQQLVEAPHLYQASLNGGETFQEVVTRSFVFFETMAQKYPDATILVVSHGLFLQTFIKTVQGVEMANIRKGTPLKNTSVSIVESNDQGRSFRVKKWNCTTLEE